MIEISKLFNARKHEGLPVQDIHMCILRSDYMVDWPRSDEEPKLKLVEYNTVAVSLLCVADRLKKLHHYLNQKYKDQLICNYSQDFDQYLKTHFSHHPIFNEGFSQLEEMVASFAKAVTLYRENVPGKG